MLQAVHWGLCCRLFSKCDVLTRCEHVECTVIGKIALTDSVWALRIPLQYVLEEMCNFQLDYKNYMCDSIICQRVLYATENHSRMYTTFSNPDGQHMPRLSCHGLIVLGH